MARIERYNAGDDSPGPLDLLDEPPEDVCPFCEGEICDDTAACEQAALEHWADLEYMHMRGK
jgi:hypothetical protein